MNLCHRIHHSGIHAAFSFVHLLLVLVICFDTLFLLPIWLLVLLTLLGSFSVPTSSLQLIHSFCFLLEFAHTCIKLDSLHNWLIILLRPIPSLSPPPPSPTNTHKSDTFKCLHRSKQIRHDLLSSRDTTLQGLPTRCEPKRSGCASGLQPNRQAKLPVCAVQWGFRISTPSFHP